MNKVEVQEAEAQGGGQAFEAQMDSLNPVSLRDTEIYVRHWLAGACSHLEGFWGGKQDQPATLLALHAMAERAQGHFAGAVLPGTGQWFSEKELGRYLQTRFGHAPEEAVTALFLQLAQFAQERVDLEEAGKLPTYVVEADLEDAVRKITHTLLGLDGMATMEPPEVVLAS